MLRPVSVVMNHHSLFPRVCGSWTVNMTASAMISTVESIRRVQCTGLVGHTEEVCFDNTCFSFLIEEYIYYLDQ